MLSHSDRDGIHSPLDGHAYSTLGGTRVNRRPELYRDPDRDEAGPPIYDDDLCNAARTLLENDPTLRQRYADGLSFTTIAKANGQDRNTAWRHHRAFLQTEARTRLLAVCVYAVSIRAGGGTFDVQSCRPITGDVWAVGIKRLGRRTRLLSASLIEDYMRHGPSYLPLGTYAKGGLWYLDRVRLIRDQDEAIRFGLDEDQDSIFHLDSRLCYPLLRRNAA